MSVVIDKAESSTEEKKSRIGKSPIVLPSGVKVSTANNIVTVEGPKGKLSQVLSEGLKIDISDKEVHIICEASSIEMRAQHGLMRTLIDNMVQGVSKGFEKGLEIIGVGYKVALKGKDLDLALGFSHPCVFKAPAGIEFAVEGNNKITVKGNDKQLVGQVAANIRMLRKPEPYKGKGIRYAGERVILKAGKSGKK